MEVGAPDYRDRISLEANALTPRFSTSPRYLGQRSIPPRLDLSYLFFGCGSRWPSYLWCFHAPWLTWPREMASTSLGHLRVSPLGRLLSFRAPAPAAFVAFSSSLPRGRHDSAYHEKSPHARTSPRTADPGQPPRCRHRHPCQPAFRGGAPGFRAPRIHAKPFVQPAPVVAMRILSHKALRQWALRRPLVDIASESRGNLRRQADEHL